MLGADAKLYRNTGTHAIPVWLEVENVRDLSRPMEKGEAEVGTRGSGKWEQTIGTRKKALIDFQMVYDPDDEDFAALQEAFFADTAIEFAVMDGDIAVAGAQGLRAFCEVFKFGDEEPLDGAVMTDVSLKPTRHLEEGVLIAPDWYVPEPEEP